MNPKFTRRSFLQGSLFAGAALSLPARVRAAVEGANGDIRIAVVGFKGRGGSHISAYSTLPGVRIVALCDVDKEVLESGIAQLKKKNLEVQGYSDIRKLLESKEIDAVSIATPNHWHSLGAIWAIQAGKDVYVEKPVSHNVWEGRQLVKATEAHQRIVQMGVQSRSAGGLAAVLEWVKNEPLGKLRFARGLCYKRRPSIGKVAGEQPWPETVDRELWTGPAELLPLTRQKLHYDWHWVWNTGNGDLGNQGIHQMDIARRFLDEDALPPAVFSIGGRLGYDDDGETPNSQFVFQHYKKAPLIFEVRGLPAKSDAKEMDKHHGVSVGVVVQFEHGYIVCPDYNNAAVYDDKDELLRTFGAPPLSPDVVKAESFEAAPPPSPESLKEQNHFGNFLQAMRSRKTSELNGKIIDGHISSALCHIGNISYRLGKKLAPEAIKEKLEDNKEAAETFGRLAEHLDANGVDLTKEPLTLGAFLKMDPKTEKFIGNAAADKLLTRKYRAPFIVPVKV